MSILGSSHLYVISMVSSELRELREIKFHVLRTYPQITQITQIKFVPSSWQVKIIFLLSVTSEPSAVNLLNVPQRSQLRAKSRRGIRTRNLSQKGGLLQLLYSGMIFLSAALLFWVEPLLGKMVLPLLGGS